MMGQAICPRCRARMPVVVLSPPCFIGNGAVERTALDFRPSPNEHVFVGVHLAPDDRVCPGSATEVMQEDAMPP